MRRRPPEILLRGVGFAGGRQARFTAGRGGFWCRLALINSTSALRAASTARAPRPNGYQVDDLVVWRERLFAAGVAALESVPIPATSASNVAIRSAIAWSSFVRSMIDAGPPGGIHRTGPAGPTGAGRPGSGQEGRNPTTGLLSRRNQRANGGRDCQRLRDRPAHAGRT